MPELNDDLVRVVEGLVTVWLIEAEGETAMAALRLDETERLADGLLRREAAWRVVVPEGCLPRVGGQLRDDAETLWTLVAIERLPAVGGFRLVGQSTRPAGDPVELAIERASYLRAADGSVQVEWQVVAENVRAWVVPLVTEVDYKLPAPGDRRRVSIHFETPRPVGLHTRIRHDTTCYRVLVDQFAPGGLEWVEAEVEA